MVRGEPLSEQDLRFFRWHRTLWVHAFRAEVAGGGAAPRAQDLTLLRDLKESLAGSSRNGLVFAGYGTLVTALLAVTLLLWCRWRRPEEEEGSDRGRGA